MQSKLMMMGVGNLCIPMSWLYAAGFDYYGNPENDPIHPSQFLRKLSFFFTDPDYLTLYGSILVIIFAFFLFAYRLGRTKPLPDYRDLSSPPFQLSPAAIRFVENMGYDTKCLVVGVVNASVKGCYQIRWGKKGFGARLNKSADFSRLTNDEKSALTFRKDHYWERVRMGGSYSAQTRKMGTRMGTYLKKRYGDLFQQKRPWVIAGIALSICMGFVLFGLPQNGRFLGGYFLYLLVVLLLIVVPALFLKVAIRDKYGYGILMCLFFLLAGGVGISILEYKSIGPYMTPVLLPIIGMNCFFFKKIPTYTRNGQVVMREIRAYRKYLRSRFRSSEQDAGSVDETILRDLPYAMALDLETGHTEYFESILTETEYEPYQIFDQTG